MSLRRNDRFHGLDRGSRAALSRWPAVVPEIHWQNSWYGHSATLKRYARVPRTRVIKAAIEHGPATHSEILRADWSPVLPIALCSSTARAEQMRSVIGALPEVIAIGPMISYATALPVLPHTRSRLLVFPVHSTPIAHSRYDPNEFLARIASISDPFDEVVCCFHMYDVYLGRHFPFAARGYRCVSAGTTLGTTFLGRLRGLIEACTVVLTNTIGTHVFYSLALGRPVWYQPQQIEMQEREGVLGKDADLPLLPSVAELQWALREEVARPTTRQLELANVVAGFDCTRSPEAIRNLLDEAERRYRIGLSNARYAVLMLRHWRRWPLLVAASRRERDSLLNLPAEAS